MVPENMRKMEGGFYPQQLPLAYRGERLRVGRKGGGEISGEGDFGCGVSAGGRVTIEGGEKCPRKKSTLNVPPKT